MATTPRCDPLPCACCPESSAPRDDPGLDWAVLGLLILLAGLTMNVSLAANLSAMTGPERTAVHGALAVAGCVAVALTWRDLLAPAWRALRHGRWAMEQWFLAGTAAAWGLSLHATLTGSGPVYYEVPVLLPAIRRFATVLLGRQRRALEHFHHHLATARARVRTWRHGSWQWLETKDLTTGDILRLMPGDWVPADGTILHGRSFVQTRGLTGEAHPVVMETGGPILAGMHVMDGELQVQLTGPPADAGLSRIMAATRLVLEQPPPFLRSARKVLHGFLPLVGVTALASACFWAWRASPAVAVHHALAVVLIACPCAFGVALPLLFRRGLAACLHRGIEPNDPAFMESLSTVRRVAFDKTGTLTTRMIEVSRIACAPDVDADELRRWLIALHVRSDHPVARPFWNWTADATDVELRHLQVVPGRGLQAQIRSRGIWHDVRVGNDAFMETPAPAWLNPSPGRRLFVRKDAAIVAVCELAEAMRPSAQYACRELSRLGWRTAVLTGDATVPADLRDAADECHCAQAPDQKARVIARWQHHHQPVLYLGDAPNDAPALAAAAASIAIDPPDAWLTDAAHACWRHPDLAALPGLLAQARDLAITARRILRVSISYNLLGMAVAAAGLLHPAAAAVIMFVSSATVVHMATRKSI